MYTRKGLRARDSGSKAMFEFDQYQRGFRDRAPARRPAPYRHVTDIAKMSFMLWGEHCIECAAPGCYATCDLYQRRPDGRCRRFAYGILRNRRFRSLRGYGAEITFKTWAKLEAEGNAHMEEVRTVLRRERVSGRYRPVLRALAAAAFAITRNPKWKTLPAEPRKLARRLHRHGLSSSAGPSSFLLEVYNPSDGPVTLQLVMRVAAPPEDRLERLPPPFLTRVELASGYSCHRFDRTRFRHILESGHRFKVTLAPEGDVAVTLVFLTADFVVEGGVVEEATAASAAGPAADARRPDPPIKCVVFDLDNTVWNGTLLEGGIVFLRNDMVQLIHALDTRGILMSIASKNDFAFAWQRLQKLYLDKYFIYPEINWSPKSDNIRKIAARLNIGLDTFAFIDDSPFELAEVSQALPMVSCFPARCIDGMLDAPRFHGSSSADAAKRREYYKDAIQRDRYRAEWGGDYVGFLRSCEIKLTARPYDTSDFERVAELVQRTNQLNFSGRSYSRLDLANRLADLSLKKYVLTCHDRYGSYGTVGFALVSCSSGEIRVEELMVSCRVQGRFIEQAFFDFLVREAAEDNPSCLWVRFAATGRNRPAQLALERMNFERDQRDEGFRLNIVGNNLSSDVVQVFGSGGDARPCRIGIAGGSAAELKEFG
ncbi:MAG: HAD-IIIC family phosphatase [Hyphomicrobium sp.]